MSTFVRRLKYYGIGFSIGLVFLIFFFQNKGCSWLPDNRVKSAIVDRIIVVPEDQEKSLSKMGIDSKKILDYLENGNVDFSSSVKSGIDKRYLIELEGSPNLWFTLPVESFISTVYIGESEEVTRSGRAKMIHFPANPSLIYVDTTEAMKCQMTALKLDTENKILTELKLRGGIDFDRSKFDSITKPVHYLEVYTDSKDTIGFKAIWYKEKVNIEKIITRDSTDCE